MNERDEYRSKLRTPKKEIKAEPFLWEAYDYANLSLTGPSHSANSPGKTKGRVATDLLSSVSPSGHGYFLRTPSPFKLGRKSPQKANYGIKPELTSTPSPHKAGPATDLFGNRSLLDNLPIPEWDDHFLDNFQEDLLFGIGSEDLEGLAKSPLKSPRRGQTLLNNSPAKRSPAVSPFKSPLLTSSPKLSFDSPNTFMRTPDVTLGRPLTRQRKLFLQSPERQMPSLSGSSNWPVPFPLSSMDETSSSLLSDEQETTTSIQSLSTYLKQLDDEEQEEDYMVMPPNGWTSSDSSKHVRKKSQGKGKGKMSKHGKCSYSKFTSVPANKELSQGTMPNTASLNTSGSKKSKAEPQFTLLRPHTELQHNQIYLHMTPCTPPNKIKISRDFSQIQTLPSKEQLRIVRNRFRETLNKAVQQVLEKEKAKRATEQEKVNDPALRSALQRPVMIQPAPIAPGNPVYAMQCPTTYKPPMKKRKR